MTNTNILHFEFNESSEFYDCNLLKAINEYCNDNDLDIVQIDVKSNYNIYVVVYDNIEGRSYKDLPSTREVIKLYSYSYNDDY